MASSTLPTNPDHGPPYHEGTDKPKYKSYKKKFLKLRHTFRDRMRESNALFDEEERAKRIVGRMQEQNDQLLDLLLDVNDSHRIPPALRFDLRSPPPSPRALPPLMPDSSEQQQQQQQEEEQEQEQEQLQKIASAQRALLEAKQEHHAGLTGPEAYRRTEQALLDIIDRPADPPGAYPLSLARLEGTSHSTRGCVPEAMMPDNITEAAPVGFLSAGHEEEFFAGLDGWLDQNPGVEYDQRGIVGSGTGTGMGMGSSSMGRGGAGLLPTFGRPKMHSEREREKEMQLRNPVSVFNWLAEHKVREVEEEGGAGAGGGGGGGGGVGGHEKPANSSSKVVAAARREKVSSPKPPVGAGVGGGGGGGATPSARGAADAAASSSARSGLKRERAGALLPKAVQDEEILDEDGSVIGGAIAEEAGLAGSRGSKRKRGGNQDGDDAYRPKGGGSKKRRRAGTKDRTGGAGGLGESTAKGGDDEGRGGEEA